MDSQQAEVNVYISSPDSQNKSSSPSKVSVNSPMSSEVTQDNYQESSFSNTQLSGATTITLSSPSQALEISSQETRDSFERVDKECQTSDGVFLSKYEYENLKKQASFCPDFQNDLMKIRPFVSNMPSPEMNPQAFEQMCKNVGADNLYNCIKDAICSEKMSDERKHLSEVHTKVIIYIMVCSKSQKSNSFQVALSRILLQFGISQQGLESLKNLGITAHPETIRKNVAKSSSLTENHVLTFVESAIKHNHFIIFCIDDYHNIHTMHRPETKIQIQSIHMATLLLKVFPNIKAVAHHGHNALPAQPVQIKELQNFVKRNLSTLSKTFAENMPDWVTAKYFDPEAERHRLLTHDYQQTDIYHTRCMENTKLVDSIHLPLKCRNDVLTVLKKMLASGLKVYLSEFIAPFIGDWPMQFFIRQLVYSNTANIPATIKNVIPFIGPLHISLNARECAVLNFQDVFSDLYTFLFGNKACQETTTMENILFARSYLWRMDPCTRCNFVSLWQE